MQIRVPFVRSDPGPTFLHDQIRFTELKAGYCRIGTGSVFFVPIRFFLSVFDPLCPDLNLFVRMWPFLSGSSLFVWTRPFLSWSGLFCLDPTLFVRIRPFCPDPALFFVWSRPFLFVSGFFCLALPFLSGSDPFCPDPDLYTNKNIRTEFYYSINY